MGGNEKKVEDKYMIWRHQSFPWYDQMADLLGSSLATGEHTKSYAPMVSEESSNAGKVNVTKLAKESKKVVTEGPKKPTSSYAGIPGSSVKTSQRAIDLQLGLAPIVEALQPKGNDIERASARISNLAKRDLNPLSRSEVTEALDWLLANASHASIVNGVNDEHLIDYLNSRVFHKLSQ